MGIARRAAGKELLLELGGNGPLVVMDDADLEAAVAATLAACYLNAGQSCTAGERILVHRQVHERFVDALRDAVAAHVRMGDPLDDTTTMGPLNNEANAAKTAHHVADAVAAGATVIAGGRGCPGCRQRAVLPPDDPGRGHGGDGHRPRGDVRPGGPGHAASRDLDEALRHRQRVVLRPAVGYLHPGPAARAAASPRRPAAAGSTSTRAPTTGSRTCPSAGRAGSTSGLGRVGGRYSLERLTELKTIVVNLA